MTERKKVTFENEYQVGSGANFTCSTFGHDCTVLAGADDTNRLICWKLTNTKPKVELSG
jgi:hypothetical protein